MKSWAVNNWNTSSSVYQRTNSIHFIKQWINKINNTNSFCHLILFHTYMRRSVVMRLGKTPVKACHKRQLQHIGTNQCTTINFIKHNSVAHASSNSVQKLMWSRYLLWFCSLPTSLEYQTIVTFSLTLAECWSNLRLLNYWTNNFM